MAALVSLSAGGAITGFSFVPKAAADFSSPTSLPLNLVALQQAAQPALADQSAPGHDAMLRAAIVHVAGYYLRMARTKTPAEMEAMIWQHDSIDGVDHGQSCAAFASLTLELGAQVVGGQSWVSGGGSYPWPLHAWADVRVEPNPASLGIISIQQDAQAHQRWHPLGDGYRPLPGDWVLFDGHVEVVTKDAGGVLHTVGGDSLPNFSVNAHEYPGPLSAAGVVGFVNNGSEPDVAQAAGAPSQAAQGQASSGHASQGDGGQQEAQRPGGKPGGGSGGGTERPSRHPSGGGNDASAAGGELAAIPGAGTAPAARASTDPAIPGLVPAQRSGAAAREAKHAHAAKAAKAAREEKRARAAADQITPGSAAIPGLAADAGPAEHGGAYRRHHPSPVRKPVSETRAQQAFIGAVAPGALAAQRRYGVPAAVTIAQAIDESGWGQSELAARDHNLFGIKGTGPAGSVPLPTQEYVNGQSVSTSASFRVYHDVAESIDDHGKLLARSGYYQQAMADRHNPDKFAAALTGVYATDPNYGANLISLMRRYDLYSFGVPEQGLPAPGPAEPGPGSATIPGVPGAAPLPAGPSGSAAGLRPGRGRPRRGPCGRSRRGPRGRSRRGPRGRSRRGPRGRSRRGPPSRSRRGPPSRSRRGPPSRSRRGPHLAAHSHGQPAADGNG